AILPLRGKVLNVEKARYDKLISSEQIVILLTALGCGIGSEDFNIEKLRYHRIIIMTDADVDGAHIRTLLLTFFYRQMPQLVERGYIYIAQPPLYKIKHGKSERYIKDDQELNQHLLQLSLEGTQLQTESRGVLIEGETLGELARSYLLTEAVIQRLSDFIDSEVLHAILAFDIEIDTSSEATATASAEKITAHVNPEVVIGVQFDDKHERWTITTTRMRHGNQRVSRIDDDFLLSGDYVQLRKTAQLISGLIGKDSVIRRGEKSLHVTRFADAMHWMLNEVERSLSKQRYKGLGEMNPEQLWETTMDPAVRRLLRVQVDDAIAADEIFTTLMGDEVEPRRAFIEANALYARNIDI
ncbi:MAG TPA: toprim domain-containing protein, partial [Rugosibacter sp.]|nr:toprim domain-containing protein [Rugosibacter sp.]